MEENEQILYDLIVHEEWKQEPQLLDQVESYFWQYRGSLLKKLWKVSQSSAIYMWDNLKTQFRYQATFGCPPLNFINLMNNCLPWLMALSPDGNFIAILQDSVIEIRTAGNFEQVITKYKIEKDMFPRWRKLIWNHDNTLLCYSNSFGDLTILDITGTKKHFIPSSNNVKLKVPGTLSLALCHVEFVAKGNSFLLYTCTYQGFFTVYEVNESSCTIKWDYSFITFHPYGLAGLVIDHKNGLLVAAGNYGKEPFPNVMGDACYGSYSGISLWRFLNDTPHLTLVEDQGKALKKVSRGEWLKSVVLRRGDEKNEMLKHGIYKLKLSEDGTQIVTLHLDGRISFWSIPSMRLIKTWSKSEQPDASGGSSEGFSFDSQKKEDLTKTRNSIDVSWWSEKEIALASGRGDVMIASTDSLKNLLGESSEKFDPWPSLSQVVDGSILVLECEKRVNDPNNKAKTSWKWTSEEDESQDEVDSIRYRFKELTKQMLYFITEAERFLPAVKPPRILTNVYRLLCLKSTTPEELYTRKINLEHYGEALDLAKRFGLNTDLVYQRQWRKKRVSKITIHDYLSKIKDRYWVLDECLLRVADDFDSTEELLKYGLLGTSWEILQRIDEEGKGDAKDDGKLLPFKLDVASHEEDDESSSSREFQGSLTKKQLKICQYRRQLLHYLDRLSTYEVVLGGSFKARDKFSKEYFTKFRSCNMVHQAVECARDEDAYTLEHLFSYHGKQLLPYWLPILSNFPETTDIRYFEPVIPEIGEPPEDPEILPWLEKHHREEDWVEQSNIVQQIKSNEEGDANEDIGSFIFESDPEIRKFYKCETKAQLREWFLHRVHLIDEYSGQIDKCCELLDVGIKRGLEGLTKVHQEMEAWRLLVYEVGIDSKMTAKSFMELSESSKIKLLMSKTSDATFVNDFKLYLMPYLRNIGKKDFKKRQDLLHEFLVEIAKTDLTCCLKLLEKCSPELPEPLLPDMAEIMKIGIDCVYACKRTDQLNHCFSIVECLPSREEGVISRPVEELHIQLDQLEHLLTGAEILQYYNNPQTISYISEIKDDSTICKQLIQQLVKNAVCKGRCVPKELNKLLGHLIKLSKEVFRCSDIKIVHQIFVEELLRSGSRENIVVAEELITPSKLAGNSPQNKKPEQHLTSALYLLKYDVSVTVVLEASREYFNAAMSGNDSSMELARLCLTLVKDCPESVQDELDLINSLGLLYEFNVSMLPLQVRLCPDKLEIIDLCLKEKKNGYKKKDKLIQLSNLLQICGHDNKERIGQVNIKIAESAFEHKDYTYAGIVCVQLVDDNYSNAWYICRKLGECEKYTNFTIRQKLLSFALTYCPVHHIEEVLQEKTQLETQVLYERLGVFTKEGKKDKIVTSSKKETEEENNEDSVDGNNISILNKTKTTTKKLISSVASVADNRWVGSAMNWVKPSSEGSGNQVDVVEREIESVRHNPFYSSLDSKNIDEDVQRFNYNEFSDHLRCVSTEEKVFNQLVLRSQKLNEQRTLGKELENSDQAMLSLSDIAYTEESCLCLAYMMAISQPKEVHSLSTKHRKNTFTFLFAAYYYALQEYVKNNKIEFDKQAQIYSAPPVDVITWMLKVLGKKKGEKEEKENGETYFLSNMNKLQDLMQAKMLQALDKGVDIERFSVDNEYKRETILGLAMSVEDELINTSLLLAEKYDIPAWEVLLSHVEFLFTDSGLKAKAIRESLNKWKVDSHLKPNGDKVFERMKKYVYPEINGKDHNALLLFYVFLMNCSSPTKILEGTLTLDAHSKLLKKIKAAASSINYKLLVHGDSPLEVIRDCVDDNNVHLLAKIASKIPQADGSYLSSNKIFLANAIRMFWKKKENKDWLNTFENCKQHFTKLLIEDVVTFADHAIFGEEASDSLTQDTRLEIGKRVIKYLRQQRGQDETKQRGADDYDSLMERYDSSTNDLELSIEHLKTLADPIFTVVFGDDNELSKTFGRVYDLSRGRKQPLEKLFRDLFTSLQQLDKISKLRSLCRNASIDVCTCFQDALRGILSDIQSDRDYTKLQTLTENIKAHQEHQTNPLVTHSDVLDVVRPFCSDVTASTDVKSHVLHILESTIDLTDDDVSLLLFYQSQSIIVPVWKIEVEASDVETNDKRSKLFNKLLTNTTSDEHAEGLEKLLRSWPVFSDTPDKEHPWIRLILKKITLEDDSNIIDILNHAKDTIPFNEQAYNVVYDNLIRKQQTIQSMKWMLSSQTEKLHRRLFKDLLEIKIPEDEKLKVDKELLELICKTKTLHRFVEAAIYPALINLIVSHQEFVKPAITHLRNNGYEAEAGYILMKTREMNSSFFTLNNALDILNFRFR